MRSFGIHSQKFWSRFTVSISSMLLVVSASTADPIGRFEDVRLPGPGPDTDFGLNIAMSGNTVITGAPGFDTGGSTFGAAYVFSLVNGNWIVEGILTSNYDMAGFVAIDGDTAVVSVHGVPACGGCEAAMVYMRSNGTWDSGTLLIPTDSADWQYSSSAVAVHDNVLVVGRNVFILSDGAWSGLTNLAPSGGISRIDAAAIHGNTIALSNPAENCGSLTLCGVAYIFGKVNGSWVEEIKLVADVPAHRSSFGVNVATDGNRVIVSARNDSLSNDPDDETVHVYAKSGGGWVEEVQLKPPSPVKGSGFGKGLDVDGDTIVVGSDGGPCFDGSANCGRAFVFKNDGGNWTEVERLYGSDGDGDVGTTFGAGAAVDQGLIAVSSDGAVCESDPQSICGGLYIFRSNEPPTADAGVDQSIRAGDLVTLDGTASFDDNTTSENLLYSWTFSSIPAGSNASLLDDDTDSPAFTVDSAGTYVVRLVVTDEGGLSSPPDEIEVSSDNLAPTSDAGLDQLVLVGTSVVLDGSASSDPETDPLTFVWSISTVPSGSVSTLSGAGTVFPTFVPDLQGSYTIDLTVSDFVGQGTSDSVQVTAASPEDYAVIVIVDASDVVTNLSGNEVTNQGNQQALLNFLSQVVVAIQDGDIATAIHKLETAISRTDGCDLRGEADGNGPGRDWIADDPNCAVQFDIYALLTNALAAITP